MRGARTYYRRLIKTAALGHSWSLAETMTGVVGAIVAIISLVLRSSDANRIVSDSVSLITVAICLFLFLFRLIAAPYWMHQEDEDKRQTERSEERKNRSELEAERNRLTAVLDTRENDRRRRDEQIECLADLVIAGERLKAEMIVGAHQMADWVVRHREWRDHIESEVGRLFSAAEARRMLAIRGTIDRLVPAFNGNHQEALACISAITKEMHEMSRIISAKD